MADRLAGYASQMCSQRCYQFPWDDPDRAVLNISDAQLRTVGSIAVASAYGQRDVMERRMRMQRIPVQGTVIPETGND